MTALPTKQPTSGARGIHFGASRPRVRVRFFLAVLLAVSIAQAQPSGTISATVAGEEERDRLIERVAELATTNPARALELHGSALDLLRVFPDPVREYQLTASLSYAAQYIPEPDLDLAAGFAERSLTIAESLRRHDWIASAVHQLSAIRWKQNRYPDAIRLTQRSLRLRQNLGDRDGEARSLNNLGLLHSLIGNYVDAAENHHASLLIKEELGDQAGVATSYNNLGIIYLQTGDYHRALDYHRRARDLLEPLGPSPALADALDNLGRSHFFLGEYDTALQFHFRALTMEETLGRREAMALTFDLIAEVYGALGDTAKALEYHRDAYLLHRELGSLRYQVISLLGQARLLNQLSRPEEALPLLEEARRLADDLDVTPQLVQAYELLAETHALLQDYRLAYNYHVRFKTLHDLLVNSESSGRLAEIESELQRDRQQQEIRLLRQEAEIQDLTIRARTQDLELLQREKSMAVLWRNSLTGGLVLCLILVGLLHNRARLRRQSAQALEIKNNEISAQSRRLEEQSQELARAGKKVRLLLEQRNAILASIHDILVTLDERICITYVNTQAVEFFGRSSEELLGRPLADAFPQSLHSPLESEIRDAIRTGKTRRSEHYCAADRRWLEIRMYPFSGGISLFCADITERKWGEEELRSLTRHLEHRISEQTDAAQGHAARVRLLAAELAETEQRERRRLAQSLHDNLQQLVVVARMNLGALRRGCVDPALRQSISQTEDLLGEAIETSRNLTVELSPPILNESGLIPALEWLAGRLGEKHGLKVNLRLRAIPTTIPSSLAHFLFQASREMLYNVIKHAAIREATLILHADRPGRLTLEVEDAGAGFDPGATLTREAQNNDCFGLFSIKERLVFLGGSLQVDSAPGSGTRITLVAPVDAAENTPSAAR
ncbi:MAG: PAS domain S-box protein [Puniceicoccaceae bacterium]|nr:MAG: PAS domain S-box protein [Puniceicoccaceae bacterium]